MQRRQMLSGYDGIAIAEREWLIAGLLWIGLGALALGPFGAAARAGRVLFAFSLMVHISEALYAAPRASLMGLNARTWLLRTLMLGSFAVLALELHLKHASRLRCRR